MDKTAPSAKQVAALFGAATPGSFSISGDSVSWTGASGDWGLRRMVLHNAHLCAAAGGVDAFLQKAGHIINLSTVAGHKLFGGSAVYSATKFGVRAISEGLRQE